MLIGSKTDMFDQREVSREQGEALARKHNIRFIETSAKANVNIEGAFRDLADDILRKMPSNSPANPDRSRSSIRPGIDNSSFLRSKFSSCCSG